MIAHEALLPYRPSGLSPLDGLPGNIDAGILDSGDRYASAEDDASELVVGAPRQKIMIAMVIWLVRGRGHNIVLDSGYHRDTFLKQFPSTEHIRPDEAVKLAGVQPEQVTDIVISHAHWDHMGGIDLFPHATVWIQKEEFRYYTGRRLAVRGRSWWHRPGRCPAIG